MSLIPIQALNELEAVFEYGAKKYEPEGWKKVPQAKYGISLKNHIERYLKGDIVDESGYHALAHAMANCAIIIALEKASPRLEIGDLISGNTASTSTVLGKLGLEIEPCSRCGEVDPNICARSGRWEIDCRCQRHPRPIFGASLIEAVHKLECGNGVRRMTQSFNATYAEEAVGKCMVPLMVPTGQCVLAFLKEGRAWVRHGKAITLLTTAGPLMFHGPFRGKLFCKPGSRVLWYQDEVKRERDK